jgi:hypothetical protein
MANGQDQYNSMQANMGLVPQYLSAGSSMPTPSPADTSLRLMEQAQQRIASSQQTIQSSSMMAAQSFGAQFQQRFLQAQAIQSFSPYQAQAIAGGYGVGQQSPMGGYLPSPLMMTPAQSGVFRPQMPTPTMPIPPMYTPPIIPTPFQPQMPRPMFQTSWDQKAMTQDLQSNRMFSYGMQAPSVIGQAAGIGAGAFAGAKIGGAFGPIGGIAGAIGGGLLAGRSGISDTIGDFAQLPFKPMMETRHMGSAIQRMSQDWVVTGPQLHATGRGLTQQGSMGLAGGIKDLSEDKGFRDQTGGMFNRQDLMRMTQMSGQAGLMDMAQSVPAIQQQLKQVAVTVKRFMELTNDPDITNVIREMGQMRQFGMNMGQINQAADNMRLFSRAAGTSIRGMRETGGMPGAAVYQGMGLTAGQGFDYGNYSLMQARQTVAGGGVDPRQLALLGGVQGMAQRNMQAQASFMTMPLFAAANGQYGAGGWGAGDNPAGMGGGQGAFGMVTGAVRNMNAAVRRGGIGALASFGMQQNEIADEAASRMTPMEQTAQRFRMAQQTGSRMLRGGSAMDQFSFGAQLMYGSEVANQMSIEARDPNMWRSQREMYDKRGAELSQDYRKRLEDTAPGIASRFARKTGLSKVGKSLENFGEGFSYEGSGLQQWGADVGARVGDFFNTPEGVSRYRAPKGTGMTAAATRAIGMDKGLGREATSLGGTTGFWGEWDRFSQYQEASARQLGAGVSTAQQAGISAVTTILPMSENAMRAFGGVVTSNALGVSDDKMDAAIRRMDADKSKLVQMVDRGKRYQGDVKDIKGGAGALSKVLGKGKDPNAAYLLMNRAGTILANRAQDYIAFPDKMGTAEFNNSMITAIAESEGISEKEARAKFYSLPEADRTQILSQVGNFAKEGKPGVAEVIDINSAGEYKKDLLKKVGGVTDSLLETKATQIEDIEKKMFWGQSEVKEGFFGTKKEFTDVKAWAKEKSGLEVMMTAAAAAEMGGDKNAMARAQKEYEKKGYNKEAFINVAEAAKKQVAAMDEDHREVLAAMGNDPERVAEWTKQVKNEGIMKSVRSEKFAGQFDPYSKKLGAAWRGEKGSTFSTVDEMLGLMSDEELKEMGSKGTKTQKALAKLAKKAKGGDEKARTRLMQAATTLGGAEVEDTQTVKAEGPAAAAAEKSADAAGEMEIVAQSFGPAVNDFAKAAKMLLDTAEIQRANTRQGRNE